MELLFYVAALVAVYATLRVISTSNPMHALLNLIVSLIAVAVIFFVLGAAFAGAMQVIVYAGAIMVLFVFVVMMLNLGSASEQEKKWLSPATWVGPALLSLLLLAFLVDGILGLTGGQLGTMEVTAKQVGISLFGPYVIAVELASILLLAGLVTAWHLGREEKPGEVLSVPKQKEHQGGEA
ncbi:NADH-quinone oxidoreductase subunit J [Aeromonas schubertii]|uniref:NADH-quinone oxidoreductase subunit J n=1 Tax=Aeromonas schubertii TaxID=652 RepID=A0A0S2SP54_9GAMM|nr:NADH-quinone oxidoreductase subunit J [Aeromonas schubertii]ALP43447.1 NADH: ubiquinone oxidoreductase subunit J [Aeromonas schubertii]KUE78725.1 NADH:ubiquinone oxidoreductase subunit J [Aeromonas schubertii]MBZ6065697.1 NADH-quinone oxidoreductase subunit J [Aeromonas schubertii]MBZ6072629.1 NADH-quinone oxidoreductase subunit J [Aeromonas schubertii]QCG46996.1 NADH-quinone oxidoreductase subunit J [Aeromonas schubertii]